MAEYIEIEKAVTMPGLRVTLPPGIPGPWGEAIKGLLHVKKIRYRKVRHDLADHAPLLRWTAQASTPVVVYNDERPRSVWNDQLYFIERLQPVPPLIPAATDDRVLMFGLINLLAGENEFGWNRRLLLVETMLREAGGNDAARKQSLAFGAKYGYSPEAVAAAPARCAEIVATFARQLGRQQSHGSRYLVGDALSAADIYWAVFAALIDPLPHELCPMLPRSRRWYECDNSVIRAAATPQLMAQRDFIYRSPLSCRWICSGARRNPRTHCDGGTFEMANATTTRNSEGSFEPFNVNDLPWEQFPGSDRFKRIGRYGGGTHLGTGIDELGPGEYSNQFHYHLTEEEHIFILKGSATLYLGNHTYVLKEGDYCCFPAGQRAGHHLYNHTGEVCTFLTIGENKEQEVCYFPKTGKVRIKATGDVLTTPKESRANQK